jgi:hypothetical protein
MAAEDRYLEFVTTPTFESSAKKLLTEEDRRQLELTILSDPQAGDVIQRTGGFRKLRFRRPSRSEGKSAGARVIYFPVPERSRVYLMMVYSKGTKDDLTRAEENELRVIGRILEGEK